MIKQFGFPKAVRLNTPQEYAHVFERSSRSTSAFFTVLVRSNEQHKARLGVIVAKRYAKKAVVRNRIRRLIRESFRHHQLSMFGLDTVVLLRKVLSAPVASKQLKQNEQLKQMDQTLKRQWQEVVSLWKRSS